MTDDERSVLLALLREGQLVGAVGPAPVEAAVDHARRYVSLLPSEGHLLDLGSGGGLPGLVIAGDLPGVTVTLVDRRAKRTDFLQRAVGRLGWGHRVQVRCLDVRALARESDELAAYDAVTARSFGPPAMTARLAHPFLRPGGFLVVSEPPESRDWDELLRAADVGGLLLDVRHASLVRLRAS